MTDPKTMKMLDKLARAIECLADADGGEAHVEAVELARDVMLLAAAEKPAEAAPVAPADPDVVTHLIETVWLVAESFGAKRDCESCQAVVRKLDKRNLGYICLRHAVRESAAAPPVVAVGFGGATGRAMLESGERATQTGPEGWSAEVSPDRKWLAIYVGLRPGEDAGETLAKMLAPVGRGP